MSDGNPPREFGNPSFTAKKDLSATPKRNLTDPLIDEEQKHQKAQQRQSITFDEGPRSPSSQFKLQKALTDENTWTNAKSPTSKNAWVDSKTKELHSAFAKATKAESSTSGLSESADRWSVREGTTQDLRYTLAQIFEKYGPIILMYKGHDALGRHWVSGWKANSEQMAVVVCIEKERAKNKFPVSTASISGDPKQA